MAVNCTYSQEGGAPRWDNFGHFM